MRFEGDFVVAAPLERVWEALSDPTSLAGCVPGVESVRPAGDNAYDGTMKLRLGPIAAAFELRGQVALLESERRYEVDVRGRERLTGTVVQARFATTVDAGDDGCRLQYVLDVALLGRLGQLGQAVFNDVAAKMTAQTIACLQTRLAE